MHLLSEASWLKMLLIASLLNVVLSASVLLNQGTLTAGAFIPFTDDCFKAVTFNGTPTGKIVSIQGVNTYIALPKSKFDRSKALVILTDIFGLPSVNNLLLADDFARQGFQTFIPDYLNGDPIPETGNTNITEWITRHGPDQTIPPLLTVINALRSQGVKSLAASGYCFGGLYATLLSQNNTIQVATMAHPSSLTVPDDFQVVKAKSDVPLQIHNAEFDTALTPTLALQVDAVLGNGQYLPGYNRTQWPGVGHGFAVRANVSDPVQVAAKVGAFFGSLHWIKEHI